MYKVKGFTLIELMLVVCIVGIIAMLAVPSYSEHQRKARRSDAYAAIQQVEQAQQRYFQTQKVYASFADPYTNTAILPSPQGYYSLSVVANNATQSYEITATTVATKAQAGDTKCTSLTLASTGHKMSTGTLNDAGNGTACWH